MKRILLTIAVALMMITAGCAGWGEDGPVDTDSSEDEGDADELEGEQDDSEDSSSDSETGDDTSENESAENGSESDSEQSESATDSNNDDTETTDETTENGDSTSSDEQESKDSNTDSDSNDGDNSEVAEEPDETESESSEQTSEEDPSETGSDGPDEPVEEPQEEPQEEPEEPQEEPEEEPEEEDESGSLTVTVRDAETGDAITNGTVTIHYLDWGITETVSINDGQAVIETPAESEADGFDTVDVELTADVDGYTSSEGGHATTVDLNTDDTYMIELQPEEQETEQEAPADASGSLFVYSTHEAEPISNASVTLTTSDETVPDGERTIRGTTGPNGEYPYDLYETEYQLTLSHPDYSDRSSSLSPSGSASNYDYMLEPLDDIEYQPEQPNEDEDEDEDNE